MKYSLIIKIVGICILVIVIVGGFFLLFVNGFFTPFIERVLNEKQKDIFYTSKEHMEHNGIEIIKFPFQEEQELHSMIEEIINASFYYYNTGEEEEFEKMRDLFVTAEYKEVKDNIFETRKKREIWEGDCGCPTKIPKIEFSQPRRYRDLDSRIGIIISIPFVHPDFLGGGCVGTGSPHYIFIFNKINNERKVERMKSICIKLEWTEEGFIQKLLYLQRLGIDIIELPYQDEQDIHSIIEKEYQKKILQEYKEKISRIPKDLEIVKIKFEQPRKYRDLEGRIGIISYIDETEPPGYVDREKWEIFIFKKIDNEWEIEKNIIMSRNLREGEQNLIQNLLKK